MKDWLAETHSAGFELARHSLVRFFDSDLVTTSGQWTKVLIGAFSLLVPVFMIVVPSLGHKYAYLSSLPSPEPYRHNLRADELWLITLAMSVVGLLAAVEWQALFPGLRDYLSLGSLPVRPRQIFVAKFLALFALLTATIVVVNSFPTVAFAGLSHGHWEPNPSYAAHFLAHGASCVLASYFLCFAIVACQGILLNLLPPRLFASVTGYVQGLLITLMLVLIVLSLSIDSKVEMAVLRPEISRWLPPVWFLGLYQAILGDPDPQFRALAARALAALAAAVGAAILSYLVSYQRHRRLFVEGASVRQRDRKIGRIVLDWAIPNPRQQAVFVFMAQTLARQRATSYGADGLPRILSRHGAQRHHRPERHTRRAARFQTGPDRDGIFCECSLGFADGPAHRFPPPLLHSGGTARQLDFSHHRARRPQSLATRGRPLRAVYRRPGYPFGSASSGSGHARRTRGR
ncbi:MAG TPA: hypothetical protein VG096_15775 [Bryobacteraceae bacterium]|jgi:hypothetical protein|nr:hypothetical protein [Bryobacteraceae bacterium]